jgi:hypothetical protein
MAREPDPTHPGRYKYEPVISLTLYINVLNARVEELGRHTSAGNEPGERS